MAVINTPITNDFYQLIRENIAAILIDELPNQAVLQSTDDDPENNPDPDLNITKVWRERVTRFNPNELPAVNLKIGELDYTDKFQRQRNLDAQYIIDVWTSSSTTEDGPADELAEQKARKIMRNIQYILDHPHYHTLGNKPYIKHAAVDTISPANMIHDDSGRRCGMRLILNVNTMSSLQPLDLTDLAANDTTVKLNETELGYFYTLNF